MARPAVANGSAEDNHERLDVYPVDRGNQPDALHFPGVRLRTEEVTTQTEVEDELLGGKEVKETEVIEEGRQGPGPGETDGP